MKTSKYLQDAATRNLTLRNGITLAVVGVYIWALIVGNVAAEALAVPAGIAIGWAVERGD